MTFRHEWKHLLTPAEALEIRSRLRFLMQPDPHADETGAYFIRSLYFDTPEDKALLEKIDGVNRREKFRLRCYNGSRDMIRLEKKSKLDLLCSKETAVLSLPEAKALINGDIGWMASAEGRPVVTELYLKMKCEGLRPKTLVDYTREPFIYRPGNVRVTLDSNIRTGLRCTDFLNADCVTVPAGDAPIILEVKWDAYLPDLIRDAVQLHAKQAAAFSKYAACRIYG